MKKACHGHSIPTLAPVEEPQRADARRRKLPDIIRPSAEEDAAIAAGAQADRDNPLLTEGELAQFKPARPRGRPVQEATKVPTTMRLDSVVLDSLKATGDGWQTRVNLALRDYLAEHDLLAHRYHATVHKHEKETERLGEFLVVAVDAGAAREKLKHHLQERGMVEAARGKVYTVDVGNARMSDLEVIY